jgi:lipoate-protein ligase B
MRLIVRNLRRMEYGAALAEQERVVRDRIGDHVPDQLLLVEHDPVYTLGRGADWADLRGAHELLGVPVYRVSRGGGVTFHGPGQLVAYPILKLGRGQRDVHGYLRRLEQAVIATCAEFGAATQRREGLTGVWLGEAKLASIGVGLRRWVTFHGLALNVSTDLGFFSAIVPCREPGMRVTSLSGHLDRPLALAEIAEVLGRHLAVELEREPVRELAA